MCARWDSTVRTLEEELRRDLGVRVAERDQAQHVELARLRSSRRRGGGGRRTAIRRSARR